MCEGPTRMRRNDLRALYTRNAAERSVPSKVVSIRLPQASRTEAYRSNLVGARRLRTGRAAALSRTAAGCAKTPGGWPGENGSQKSQKQMVAGRRPLTMGCAVWSVQGLSRRLDTFSSLSPIHSMNDAGSGEGRRRGHHRAVEAAVRGRPAS